MLLVYTDELLRSQNTREEMKELIAGHAAVKREAKEKGALHMGAPLKPTSTATTIRINDGEVSIVDGPFAATKEQLAGFYVLECENLDEAMEWAKKFASACWHRGDACFEIRPVEDYSYLESGRGDAGS
jgi:hypothetical protein